MKLREGEHLDYKGNGYRVRVIVNYKLNIFTPGRFTVQIRKEGSDFIDELFCNQVDFQKLEERFERVVA